MFEITTSIDLFKDKLSQATVRRLRGRTFETKDAMEILEHMFRATTDPDHPSSLSASANICKMFLDRQIEYNRHPQAWIESLKVYPSFNCL